MKKINLLQWVKQISRQWAANFVSNVLGVIIGIALTFGISYLIQRHDEKKQVREMMILIKQELEENKDCLSNQIKKYELDYRAYQDFLAPESYWSKIPKDSLVQDIFQFRNIPVLAITSNAWNILQNSGMVQKFHNTDLIVRLSECYILIDKCEKFWNQYIEAKDKAADNHIYVQFEIEPLEYISALMKIEESKKFLENNVFFPKYRALPEMSKEVCTYIDFVLHLIDESGDYHYKATDTKDAYEDFKKKHSQ